MNPFFEKQLFDLQLNGPIMNKTKLLFIILFFNCITLANEIEKNKILNIMVDHNYELTAKDYGVIGNFFTFPFTFNDLDKTLDAKNEKELKKIFKKLRRGLPKDHSHRDWKKMNVKLLNNNIALVNSMFSRFNKKGEIYFTGSELYIFRKADNSWKISSITPYKPYNYFEFD